MHDISIGKLHLYSTVCTVSDNKKKINKASDEIKFHFYITSFCMHALTAGHVVCSIAGYQSSEQILLLCLEIYLLFMFGA